LTLQLASLQRERSSDNRKTASAASIRRRSSKLEGYVPLLPEIIGIRIGSQGQPEILTKGGQIQTKELWTTEALVDNLVSRIIQVKEENELPNLTRSPFLYDRKYLNCAVAVIVNWSKIEQNNQRHQFVFFLSDIITNDGRLAAELIDLGRTTPSTLAYVLHKVVERLFDMVGASRFYQSASEKIQVRID
jgi:hypothetical protein